jgi:ribosomal protein S18 acetylase RimI-like enzyme
VLKIFPVNEEAIPLVRDLTFRIWPQTYSGMLEDDQVEYMMDMMYSESSLQKQMHDGAQFIIIYDNQDPIGFASYQEIGPGLFKLHKIYILSNQQGKGTGRYMIDYIIDKIKNKGATSLQLQVNKKNKAKLFYEKLGFNAIDEIKLDIGGGYVMDDYIMEKTIVQGP